jgi:phosphoenolpyruvate carboxykinase (ATP)
VKFTPDPIFQVQVPDACPGVPSEVLNPRQTWKDQKAYDQKAEELAKRFVRNSEQFSNVPPEVVAAGPKA